jgi:hypothetical protein
MPPVELKLVILASDRPQTPALDRTTTVIGCFNFHRVNFFDLNSMEYKTLINKKSGLLGFDPAVFRLSYQYF